MRILGALIIVTFVCMGAAARSGLKFEEQTIDPALGIGYAVAVADMNGDRKPDIVAVKENQVRWYENPGWSQHVIVSDATPRDNVCIAAADIDGDGLAELALGAHWKPSDTEKSGSVHWLARQGDPRKPWKVVNLEAEPTVHRMRWGDVNGDRKLELIVAPLHGRGNKPPAWDGVGAKLMVYYPPAKPESEPWERQIVDGSMHQTHNFWVGQWGATRGRDQILLAGREGVSRFEFAGGPPNGRWQRSAMPIDSPSGEVKPGRDGRGGDIIAAVQPMHGNVLAVYTGQGPQAAWKRTVLTDQLGDGHALWCADLDGNKGDEIVIGWRGPSADTRRVGVAVFSATAAGWERILVDDNGMACEDVAAGDLDGDGKIDLVASGRATRNLKIYWNKRP